MSDSPPQADARKVEPSLKPTVDFAGDTGEGIGVVGPHPQRIGHYQIREVLGEGGMGVVFLAEQTEPVRRRVALKLIKLGMDTGDLIARFESERQALALMSHPSVAAVFDAGATEQGRPYFVMEYVPGIPITDYCDRHRLTIQRRLELFVQVCEAVQHAHQKGVIHRDIKPSNVLVMLQDEQPLTKVIDFGIAKATTGRLTDRTLYTEHGRILGTPAYMSPEQADMTALDIDTRTDVYSLGVLLYELLVGATPFEPGALRQAGYSEMQRIIREVEPPRPSTRVSTIARQATEVFRQRQVEPHALERQLRGDLDWICLKAMEKDRTRRYATATELAGDVRRHLHHEPVLARPPSTMYKLAKFTRRNRGAVVAVTALVTMLVVAVVAVSLSLVRVTDERNRTQTARQRADRHLQTALQAVDRMLTRVGEKRLAEIPQMEEERRRLLEDALEFYQGLLEEESIDPVVGRETARAYRRTAQIHAMLGKTDVAQNEYEHALRMQRELLRETTLHDDLAGDLAESCFWYGTLLRDTGRFADAEKTFLNGLQELAHLPDDGALPYESQQMAARLHNALGDCFRDTNRADTAATSYGTALKIRIALAQDDPGNADLANAEAETHESLGDAYRILGQRLLAEKSFQRALEIRQRLATGNPNSKEFQRRLALSWNKLAYLYNTSTQLDEAQSAYKRALPVCNKLVVDHPGVPDYQYELATTYWQLGRVCFVAGKKTESFDAFQRAVPLLERLVSEYPGVARYRLGLAEGSAEWARALRDTGDLKQSLVICDLCIRTLKPLMQQESDRNDVRWQLSICHMDRAEVLVRLGRATDARSDWEQMAALGEGQRSANLRVNRAMALGHLADHVNAVAEVEGMLRYQEEPDNALYNFACVYSLSFAAALADSKLDMQQRQRLANQYATQAIVMLRRARDKGFFSFPGTIDYMGMDSDLAPVRATDEYKRFLTDLQKR